MKSIPLPPCSHVPQPYKGPSAEEVLALRREFLSPAIFHDYKNNLFLITLGARISNLLGLDNRIFR